MTFLKPARILRTLGRRHACTNSVNSFHHGPGSTMPAVDPSSVTLLNMRFCPYAQRTVLCLNAKNVDYSVINCTLKTKAEWPAARARDKMLVELFNRVVMPQMRIWFGWMKGQGAADRAAHWEDCLDNLRHFEGEMAA